MMILYTQEKEQIQYPAVMEMISYIAVTVMIP